MTANSSGSSMTSQTRTVPRDENEKQVSEMAGRDIEKATSSENSIPADKTEDVANRTSQKRRSWFARKPARDPYPTLSDAPVMPLVNANVFNKWTFSWIQPLMVLGAQRTLVDRDLWSLPPDFEAEKLSDKLMANFDRRRAEVEKWNKELEDGTYKPSALRKLWWRVEKRTLGFGDGTGKRKIGIALALSDTFKYTFWSGGVIKVIGDTSQVTSPLVLKALINFSTDSYLARKGVEGYTAPHIGRGVGLAVGLFLMQVLYSLSVHQFFVRSAGTGVLARSALIASIYRRSMRLSGRARTVITNGRLVNHISTDVSRIDFCAGFFHMSWTAPIQFIIIVVILLVNLGAASLTGVAFLLVMLPFQSFAMRKMFAYRKKAMVWTDKRAKLIQELLGGMRIIKFFAWEKPYLEKVGGLRGKEMEQIRGLLIIRAANMAIAISVPGIAVVIAFLVYTTTGNFQDPAVIFTSLSLFNMLRMPIMMLPMSLSTITDAYNALGRLTEVFLAEERSDQVTTDRNAEYAIKIENGDFQWEGTPPEGTPAASNGDQFANMLKAKAAKKEAKKKERDEKKRLKQLRKSGKGEQALPTTADQPVDAEALAPQTDAELGLPIPSSETPATPVEHETLQVRNIDIQIPRGQLCAIVGPVGSGKSSLLQAMIGEMRRTRGSVTFGGSVAYCSQQAWIQNCSLRDNILFGQPYDEQRYLKVIEDACLEADLAMLPAGDQTEIGEKGITLSGGQKQRVNIARALYYNADIVLLDDPLSAVDAHVGKHLFNQAIRGALAGKTRVLVTHALHFLHQVDYIYCVDGGKITQQGTYNELVADQEGAFSKLMNEFGGAQEEEEEEKVEEEEEAIEKSGKRVLEKPTALMQEEERKEGAVSGDIYKRFIVAAKGQITVPLLLIALAWFQGAYVMQSYWLVWWQEDHFNRPRGFYMGIYAMLGLSQAFFSFLMGLCAVFFGFNASRTLHRGAIAGIMRAPMSFFDTNPLGRIMNRFSKDIDTIDNILNDSLRMFLTTVANVLGAIVLITIIQHYFIIVAVAILTCYFFAAKFYRSSAREIKRLDNLLRSSLYAHFSESLSGMAVIRAYNDTEKFLRQNERLIDVENRAYYLSIVNQRWLGLRLDFFGAILIFAVAMFAVGERYSINPSQIGLTLSTILTISQAMTWMVRQGAEVENDMNSVERVVHYGEALEAEAPAIIEDNRPSKDWPANGSITFDKVLMAYRPGLPPVLKGLSLDVKAGEKIGIVGRTGAGKSSIMMALFRIVELDAGKIEIDGVDISKIGLQDLREKLAIIPQDALLFNGTIRTNLDPFGQYEDAVLWDALKRAWLVDQNSSFTDGPVKKVDGAATPPTTSRFTLDLPIEDEGLNLSVGERSLVSLARALVRDSRIIILDEATASVDFATDSRIQDTIKSEFKDKTLLCIAHRLRTILAYDRVLVMDAGQVAEYDTPLNLFKKQGIFCSMCQQSNITEEDIKTTEWK